jgi:SAM-dependent methyltransferase
VSETLRTVLTDLITVFVVLYALWVIVPILTGLPYVPTRLSRIRKALELVQLKPGELLYDLGAGDGRVPLMAAQEFGARAVGIEISPLHCLYAWLSALGHHLGRQISLRLANFYSTDLTNADVIFAYMTSREAPRLRPYLEKRLRPGTRVVTVSFDFDGWQPVAVDSQNLIFVYHMPPTPGNVGSYLAQRMIDQEK